MKYVVPRTFHELIALSVAMVAVAAYALTWWQL